MDRAWADLLAELTRAANALDPTVPAGFVGGQAPSTYGGYDYALLAETVQWMEAYDVGGTNEILRSFWGSSRPRVQTYFLSEDRETDTWFLWYYLVHGNRGVICWPDTPKGPWFSGTEARPSVRALAPAFADVQAPISEIFTGATFSHDGIALYYSQPSIAVSWFMDIRPHGASWVNRSSSMNNENATDILNRLAWMKLLEDSGFQYDFVSYRDVLKRRAAALDRYHVLILPRILALSDREADAIRGWVARGGTLIADYLPGVFDEHGRGRARGALDDVFGVARDPRKGVLDGRTVAEVNAEFYQKPLSERLSYDGALRDRDGFVLYERGLRAAAPARSREVVGGAAIDLSARFGSGLARYLNWTPLPYLLVRERKEGAAYHQRVRVSLQGTRAQPLEPRVRVLAGGTEMPLAETIFWDKGGKHYLCVVMNPLRLEKVGEPGDAFDVLNGEAEITLAFRTPVAGLRNERTGRVLGDGKRFPDRWVRCEANIYSWS